MNFLNHSVNQVPESFLRLRHQTCNRVSRKYREAQSAAIEDCFMQAVELLCDPDNHRETPKNRPAWLFRATELLLRNELRKQSRTTSIHLVDQESLTIDNLGHDTMMRSEVEALFKSLSSAEREIIQTRDILGLTVSEVARMESTSVKAVYHRHERAKHKARRIIQAQL
jgi:RNA polymerase sigma factor (sigma-70 family)